jgi:hypothetical protein
MNYHEVVIEVNLNSPVTRGRLLRRPNSVTLIVLAVDPLQWVCGA